MSHALRSSTALKCCAVQASGLTCQGVSEVGDETWWARANAAITLIKTVKMKSFINMCI